ncbi:MAG TPA: hypothetical protein VE935_04195 [Burkholderiales bacterium]|jgi:hypothetical protein|nr:hypothetical protein [Burkholderiales bacterium]
MDREETLLHELERLDRLHQDLQLDDEVAGEDTGMEVELLEARVKAARLAGA